LTIELAILGGTGLTTLAGLNITERVDVNTRFGKPSGPISYGELFGKKIVFLPRHGYEHTIPPHKINYRANMLALKEAGAKRIVSIAAVGGINAAFEPGSVVIPDQIIDYTWSRKHTIFEDDLQRVTHIDFTYPYSESLRQIILDAADAVKVNVASKAVYAVTQGPRLETAAEIDRLERDGCDIVGMTAMPEAALARELELDYAACAIIVNLAAGRGEGEISMSEIELHVKTGTSSIGKILEKLLVSI